MSSVPPVDRRLLPAADTRTRHGGVRADAGRYQEMNDGAADGDDDVTDVETPPSPVDRRTKKQTQTTLNFAKTTKKRSISTNNNNDIDLDNNNDVGNDNRHEDGENVDATQRDDVPAQDTSSSRVYGTIVRDRENVEQVSKRVRGADTEDRTVTSWVHQAFEEVLNKYRCRVCKNSYALGDSSTGSRRKHYRAEHLSLFNGLEAAAASGKNSSEFEKLVKVEAAAYARSNGIQLTLDNMPTPPPAPVTCFVCLKT